MEIPTSVAKIRALQTREHCVIRRLLILGGCALVTGAAVGPLVALSQTERSDRPRRINLSGRQRMLIQRAGKFVCLAQEAPQPLPLLEAAQKTLELHQLTQAGLRSGNKELGLGAESNALVLNALGQAELAFQPYDRILRDSIRNRAVEPRHLQKIAILNSPALNAMDSAVNLIERVYGDDQVSGRLAMLINISGRQRMFTQRMVLQLCLSRSAAGMQGSRRQLFITMNRFSISLNILRRVTPAGVPDEILRSIVEGLNTVRDEWQILRELMSTATRFESGHSFDAILEVDKRAEDLLERINAIVLLYEKASG